MDKEYAKSLLKETQEHYNVIAGQFSSAREKVWDEMKFLFEDYLVSGDRVLDLGCGNGRFFELMKDKNIDYYGVDISEKLIEIAKKRYPELKFQVADALNLPFPDNYFDKVYGIAVFQHIPSNEFRAQFLKEAKRVLKPGGTLILTVWNLWWKRFRKILLKNALLKLIGRSKLDFKDFFMPAERASFFKEFYYHCFTKGELERIVKKLGFQCQKSGIITVFVGKRSYSNFYIIGQK